MELRDAEIERLKGLIGEGKPLDRQYNYQHSTRDVDQLKIQADVLRSRNEQLEQYLSELQDRLAASQTTKNPGPLMEKASQCVVIGDLSGLKVCYFAPSITLRSLAEFCPILLNQIFVVFHH